MLGITLITIGVGLLLGLFVIRAIRVIRGY
jgi:hypothetical protein